MLSTIREALADSWVCPLVRTSLYLLSVAIIVVVLLNKGLFDLLGICVKRRHVERVIILLVTAFYLKFLSVTQFSYLIFKPLLLICNRVFDPLTLDSKIY